MLIVDGTLVPPHDRGVSASSKNSRCSVNMQVVIDANTRLVVAVGEPTPSNRNDGVWHATRGVAQMRNLSMTA